MKRIFFVLLVCLLLTSCVKEDDVKTSNIIESPTWLTETVITETVITEKILNEDVWVSPEYLEELEYNGRTN